LKVSVELLILYQIFNKKE